MPLRIIILLFIILTSGLSVQAQEAVTSGGNLVVPSKALGAAEIPLVYDLNYKAFVFLDRVPTCRVNYEPDGLNFLFTVPVKPGYKPVGSREQDGNIFADDRVELYIKNDKGDSYIHYAVNVLGTFADEKIHDRAWNGKFTHSVHVGKDSWQAQIKIPYSDIDVDPSSKTVKALVAAYSREPGNSFYLSSVSVAVAFKDAEFEDLVLSDKLPYLEKLKIGKASYTSVASGSLPVEYSIKNPDGSVRQLKDKFSLGNGKTSNLTLAVKDILSVPLAIRNTVIPQVDIVAQDWYHFVIQVLNEKDLAPFVKDVAVSVDNKTLLTCPLAKLMSQPMNLKDLKLGPHNISWKFMSRAGGVFASQSKSITVYDPAKVPADISKLDFSRYYKPVSFNSGHLQLTRSMIDFSKGIFPGQIEVDSREILDKPVHLMFDGKQLLTGNSVKLVSSNKNQVVLSSTYSSNGKTIKITADCRYDGYTWYDVEISSAKAFEYGPLEVVVPLKLDEDILLSRDSEQRDSLFQKSPLFPKIADTTSEVMPYGWLMKPDETAVLPLASYVTVSTDTDEAYRGLVFSTEGPRGWNIKNYDQTYKIKRSGSDLATLSVKISDGKTRWKRKSIKFGFALMPLPIRNETKDFHAFYRVDCNNNRAAFEPRIPIGNGQLSSYLDNLAWSGIKITMAHEAWTDYESYWKTNPTDDFMPKYVADAKKNNLKTIAYFGFLISNMIPEFPLYHDLFLTKPNSYPENGFTPYVYQGVGDPEQAAFGVCYGSVFGDFYAKGMIEAVTHYGWNGVFFDGGLGQVPACTNVKHGCGTVDPYGRLIPTFPVRNYRRLMEYFYSEGNKIDPAFIIDNHVGWPCPATLGLVSAYWTGECSIFFEPNARTNPESLRSMMNAKLYGIPCDFLLRPETPLTTAWAQGMLVDAYPRSVALGNTTYHARVWGLYDKYGLTTDTFTTYFSKKNQVIKDNSKVLVSYYETSKVLVLVVSNYWQNDNQNVTLDLSAFKNLKETSKDIWSDTEFGISNSTVKMNVPGLSMRLLVIEKKG